METPESLILIKKRDHNIRKLDKTTWEPIIDYVKSNKFVLQSSFRVVYRLKKCGQQRGDLWKDRKLMNEHSQATVDHNVTNLH